MDPIVTGALISGGAGLGSNILGNIGSRRAAKFAAKHNLHMWNLQNEYNHPTAQMERLKSAGLNPTLIYGTSPSSAVGNADKIAPMSPPEYKFKNPMSEVGHYANLKQSEAQTDNLIKQGSVLVQEAALKASQIGESQARTARSKFDLDLAQNLKEISMDAAAENLRQMEQRTIQLELDNDFNNQSMKDRVKSAYYQAKNAKKTLQGQDLTNELRRLEIELKRIGIERNDPWYFRILGRALSQDPNFKF